VGVRLSFSSEVGGGGRGEGGATTGSMRVLSEAHTISDRSWFAKFINGRVGPDSSEINFRDRSYGTYTRSPPNVLPFSSKSVFNRTATLRTHSLHSSRPRQLPATIQHSEHALDAEFTVSSSSSPRACSAVRISTNRLSPALHVFIPPMGFVVVSDTRYEDESPRQCRSALWSTVDDLLVIAFNSSSIYVS